MNKEQLKGLFEAILILIAIGILYGVIHGDFTCAPARENPVILN
jgi:hypothetical protein